MFRTIALYVASAVCFAVDFLLAANWLLHNGNLWAWGFAGLFLFVVAHISERLPS